MTRLSRHLVAAALVSLLALAGRPATAQTTGTLTHDGVAMPVKAAVAVLDARGTDLNIYLMPFVPTDAETEQMQKEGGLFLMRKQSPFGRFWLTWFDAASAGRMDGAAVSLIGENISRPDAALGLKWPKGFKGTLTGELKPGAPITFTSAGSDVRGAQPVAWDVKASIKVLPRIKNW